MTTDPPPIHHQQQQSNQPRERRRRRQKKKKLNQLVPEAPALFATVVVREVQFTRTPYPSQPKQDEKKKKQTRSHRSGPEASALWTTVVREAQLTRSGAHGRAGTVTPLQACCSLPTAAPPTTGTACGTDGPWYKHTPCTTTVVKYHS